MYCFGFPYRIFQYTGTYTLRLSILYSQSKVSFKSEEYSYVEHNQAFVYRQLQDRRYFAACWLEEV